MVHHHKLGFGELVNFGLLGFCVIVIVFASVITSFDILLKVGEQRCALVFVRYSWSSLFLFFFTWFISGVRLSASTTTSSASSTTPTATTFSLFVDHTIPFREVEAEIYTFFIFQYLNLSGVAASTTSASSSAPSSTFSFIFVVSSTTETQQGVSISCGLDTSVDDV